MPAVIEDVRAPVGVQAETRVLVFIEGGAVVLGERPVVLREVAGHPVEDDPQPGLVAGIDEGAQLVRRAVARGRGEVAGGLVAPGFVERVLGDRQQFEVGVALRDGVGNQAFGELAPEVGRAVGVTHPRTGVNLVDIDRGMQPVPAGAFRQPGGIVPAMRGRRHDPGGRAGAQLEAARVGVGLDDAGAAVTVDDLEAVQTARAGGGDFALPDAGGTERLHRVGAALPAVEIADHRDAGGIRRPDAENRAGGAGMGAEKAPCLEIAPLVKQVQRVGQLHFDPLSQYHKRKL